jgi:hypothetical protein
MGLSGHADPCITRAVLVGSTTYGKLCGAVLLLRGVRQGCGWMRAEREYGMGKCGQRGDGTLRLSRGVHRFGCRRSTKVGLRMGSWAASGREWECWGFVIR